ncbi:MAG: hypothetical protein J3Q66DRAFT_353535 [Benniella sp.]|nr:MAG: hypothetical protein J3Q66DRAFT_353535 [Benniella sp.]
MIEWQRCLLLLIGGAGMFQLHNGVPFVSSCWSQAVQQLISVDQVACSLVLCSLLILKNKLKLVKKRLCGVIADVADTLHVMSFGVIHDSGGLSAVPGDKVGVFRLN